MRLVKFWAVAALVPLYACNADDSNLAQETAPVESAPQAQAPQAQTAPTTEAQAEDVVEAGEEVATETGSQNEIVLAQADTSAAKTSRFTAGKDFEVVKPAQPTSAGPGSPGPAGRRIRAGGGWRFPYNGGELRHPSLIGLGRMTWGDPDWRADGTRRAAAQAPGRRSSKPPSG